MYINSTTYIPLEKEAFVLCQKTFLIPTLGMADSAGTGQFARLVTEPRLTRVEIREVTDREISRQANIALGGFWIPPRLEWAFEIDPVWPFFSQTQEDLNCFTRMDKWHGNFDLSWPQQSKEDFVKAVMAIYNPSCCSSFQQRRVNSSL